MGSMVHLALGAFEVDWGKNNSLTLHGELFQASDVTTVLDTYIDQDGAEIVEPNEGASKLLKDVLTRLELMGFTLEAARHEFEVVSDLAGPKEPRLAFEELARSLKQMDVDQAATDYHSDYDFGEFFAREIFDRLKLGEHFPDQASVRYRLGETMENLNPYAILRLLAENPVNLDRHVSWHYHDVMSSGWVERDTIESSIGAQRKFLIVTEGSSDAAILRHALNLLRPGICDFFTFVDMEEGYPFTGTGNLHRFCQGLVAIGIENRIVVLYDNDTEGTAKSAETQALNLPANIRVMCLPDLDSLRAFDTLGPEGPGRSDINGTAAAIECYLDLTFETDEVPRIRWTNYNPVAQRYQGSLLFKEQHAKRFLRLRSKESGYDFSKMEEVLDALIAKCVAIASEVKTSTTVGMELAT